ncbi:MAG: lipopolysaccharide heptosyltransferase family protein [Methylophaga sp.]|nr:lipopolysaccharide heptosyltransferase family protein [Methylophaga sp.]
MNLLITRHDKIGDFITILPMLKIIKSQSNHRITVLVSRVNYELAQSIDTIDDVILYTKETGALVKAIKARNIDVSISCFIDTHLAWVLFLARIKTRISPATKFAQAFFNNTVRQARSEAIKTEWQYNIDLLALIDLNVSYDFERPLLHFSKDLAAATKVRTVAFHSGSGGSSDGNLRLDDYLNLARSLSEKDNIRILFTFGPDDNKNKRYIEQHLDFDAELINSSNSLLSFCQLLNNVDVFVSTSTGPMHLAGALNIHTLSFFGSSQFASPKRWATVNDASKQSNIQVPDQYSSALYQEIEAKLADILKNRR